MADRFQISNERLLTIGQTCFDDFEDAMMALREVALALYERSIAREQVENLPLTPGSNKPYKDKLPGRPLGDRTPYECPGCHEMIVNFVAKASGKTYQCNVETGMYQGVRKALSAPNWFHDCPNRRRQ